PTPTRPAREAEYSTFGLDPSPAGGRRMAELDEGSCLSPSEPRRCRVHHGDAAVADLAHFHRALADAVAAEAERAVEAEKAVLREHPPGREVASRLPVAGDAQRQQHCVVAERGHPERLLPEAGFVAGGKLAIAAVRYGREQRAAQRTGGRDAGLAAPQLGPEQIDPGTVPEHSLSHRGETRPFGDQHGVVASGSLEPFGGAEIRRAHV